MEAQTINQVHTSTLLNEIVYLTKEAGGVTVNLNDGYKPAAGYAVAAYPSREVITARLDIESLESYIVDNADVLRLPAHYLGTWYNPDNGKVYLDISIVEFERAAALETARRFNQLAIFDLSSFETITL